MGALGATGITQTHCMRLKTRKGRSVSKLGNPGEEFCFFVRRILDAGSRTDLGTGLPDYSPLN